MADDGGRIVVDKKMIAEIRPAIHHLAAGVRGLKAAYAALRAVPGLPAYAQADLLEVARRQAAHAIAEMRARLDDITDALGISEEESDETTS
jgi:hypothetical protein